jgi:hypothetical protein
MTASSRVSDCPETAAPDAARDTLTSLPVAAIEQSAAAALAWLPVESLERLAPYLAPSAIRRRRDEERNVCYRGLAAGLPPANRMRELARAIATEIGRYQHGRWRFEHGGPPPADPRRALMHRILTLDGGKILAPASLRRVLAGIAGAKSAEFLRQQPRHTTTSDSVGARRSRRWEQSVR